MDFQEEDDIIRSSRSHMFLEIGVLKNSAIFTGKYLCCSLFLIKLLAFKAATLFERDSSAMVQRCHISCLNHFWFSPKSSFLVSVWNFIFGFRQKFEFWFPPEIWILVSAWNLNFGFRLIFLFWLKYFPPKFWISVSA